MAVKTYVLLPHTNSTASNIYMQVNANERVRLNKRIVDHAYLQLTFQNKSGNQQTIRLKLGCDEIDQQKQIKEFSIPANTPFTQEERDSVKFRNGVCVTDNEVVQKYMDETPENEKFWDPKTKGKSSCTQIKQPKFKEYDATVVIKSDNAAFHKRLQAANVIATGELPKLRELLIRLFGVHYMLPKGNEETQKMLCQNALVSFLDDADETGLDEITRTELTLDEQMKILVAKANEAGILQFDEVTNMVIKVKNGTQIPLREISSEYPSDQRVSMFIEFLSSREGKLIARDLEDELRKQDEKPQVQTREEPTVKNKK